MIYISKKFIILNNMKKILCFILSIFTLYLGTAFAINTGTNDCSVLNIQDWNYTSLPKWKYTSIMPEESFKKVFDNLRAACCKWEIHNYCDGINIEWNFPDSVFLFDHLLDVYLRRLDAKWQDDNWEDLMYWLQADEKWKERRDAISDIWNNSEGTPPLQIKQLYEKHRKWNIYLPKYNDDLVQKDMTSWKSSISWEIKNFTEWTLIDRYNNACDIITYIYLDITNNMTTLNISNSDKQAKLKNIYNSCTNLINNRISSERVFTEAIAQNKWNSFLDNNIDAYLNVYFLNNHLSSLQSVIHNRQNAFAEIVKSINNLTKKCS